MSRFAEYLSYDALGLAALVRTKGISALELVDEAIARIEALNPRINAVVHTSFERARKRAQAGTLEGPFAGVPFLVKDLLAEQAGEPCAAGSAFLRQVRMPHDSEIVRRYERAGVVILGRTNTPELGIYAVTEPRAFGVTRNPWDLNRTPGGSSGGSAAAVASGMVPMAHGGDGGGSIRIPASHCGLVGLKPTRGRNPIGPYVGDGWGGIVSQHVLTRSVRDCAAMLDATQGPELGAPYAAMPPERPYMDEIRQPAGTLRIAYTTEPLFGDTVHPDCVAALEHTVKLLTVLGHKVEVARPPFDRPRLVRAYLANVAVGVATALRIASTLVGRQATAADVEPATWLLKLIGEALSAGEYGWLQHEVHRAGFDLARFGERYDVLLTPTTAQPPVPVGTFALTDVERLQLKVLSALPFKALLELALADMSGKALAATPNTMLFNLTGQPAMSLPLWWNGDGLPIGTQFVGRFGDEATLLRLAAQLEEAQPWAQRRPAGSGD
ncbi:MAG: amidase [Myxococcota bacterium]